jgi:hypothetical protein
VHLKFSSKSGLIWYVTEGSPEDDDFVFFGFVIGPEREWGRVLAVRIDRLRSIGIYDRTRRAFQARALQSYHIGAKLNGSMKTKLLLTGLAVGGLVGFLLRPSVPLMGQLPFITVITRGANLRGLDQLLTGYARTSFNYLVAGIIVGAVTGLIVAFLMSRQKA